MNHAGHAESTVRVAKVRIDAGLSKGVGINGADI